MIANKINDSGLEEMNMYWPEYSTQQQLQECMRGYFEITVSAAAYKRHNTKVQYQQGGTVIIAWDKVAHLSHMQEYDSIGR